MKKHSNKNKLLGRGAMLLTTLIWGTSFVVLKNTLSSISPLYVLAIRFSGAAVLLCLFGIRDLKKIDRAYLKGGAAMGVFLLIAYIMQTYGLAYTTPGKNAFLTATYCVLAPLLGWVIYRHRPDRFNISAAIICIVGIGFVSLGDDLSVNIGDALTVCCGVFYALHLLATEKYADGRKVILLTMIQFAVAGALAWVFALVIEPVPRALPKDTVISIVYLTVMCSAVCYVLQTFSQKYTPSSEAAVIMSLESVFGVVFSMIFYHEVLTAKLIIGFALIFAAVLISETKLSFLKRKPASKVE